MQKDSMHFSTPGISKSDPAIDQKSQIRPFQCSHCTLILKSKVSLFEHLNQEHGFDVDAILRDAGLKNPGTGKTNTDNRSSSPGNHFECHFCDFKTCSRDILSDHEKQCQIKSENRKVKGNLMISENPKTDTNLTNHHTDAAEKRDKKQKKSVIPNPKTKCPLNSSKDVKTCEKPQQNINKYFRASSGSNGNPPVKLNDSAEPLDSTKGTLLLQESPTDSIPNSRGVLKVTAKPTVDIVKHGNHCLLLDEDHQTHVLKPPKSVEQIGKQIPNNICKRAKRESSKSTPAKKAKPDKEEIELQEKGNTSTQQPSGNKEFSFEISKEKDDKKVHLVNGDTESSRVYFCKHCDYSDVIINNVRAHYQNDHPYVRCNADYIQDPSDKSATFRCLECPVEFSSIPDLKRHYTENHPEGPDLFKLQCRELSFVFKCFVCPFTTNLLKELKIHYREKHPTHRVDNSLMLCRYSVTRCQEGPLLKKCENVLSTQTPGEVTHGSTSKSCKEAKNRASPERPTCKTVDPSEASKTHSESAKTKKVKPAEDKSKDKKSPTKLDRRMSTGMDGLSNSLQNELFYCQFCSYSSPNIKSVVGHHNAKHAADVPISTDQILIYSSQLQKKKLKSEAEASARATPSNSYPRKQAEMCSKKNHQYGDSETADALEMQDNPYAFAENLFYCQKCNYGNPSAQGVVNHQAKVHHSIETSFEHVREYTVSIREEIKKSKSQAENSSFSNHLPLPLMLEGEGDIFFCHFCNYRHRTLYRVLRHYVVKHQGFEADQEQVKKYTWMVLKQRKKSNPETAAGQEISQTVLGKKGLSKKKTNTLGKISESPSVKSLQPQRTIHCRRCSYTTQYFYLLRRHMWKKHHSNRSTPELLRLSYKKGDLQTGYHCYLCLFSHTKAAALYEHFQTQHPERKLSLEYVANRLYVGPEICFSKKKPQTKQSDGFSDSDGTDGSAPAQASDQSDTMTYLCKACSYEGTSMSNIIQHYRAVHPWSVKEDGSVLHLIKRKRNANRQAEDQNEIPPSFDTYQVPLDFEKSPYSSQQAASSEKHKCPFCPAMFPTLQGLNIHCGADHQKEALENKQIQTHVHVFKCSHCTYVNTNYQGVLTHCQMRHSTLPAKVDSLDVDKADLHNWEDCVKIKGPSSLRLCGYMCKICPKISATPEKLRKHYEEDHNETGASLLLKKSKSALPAVGKRKQHQIHSNQGSISKASFLNKKIHATIKCQYCSYDCATKIALLLHLKACHNITTISKARDCFYKCALCSQFYFKKKHLGSHYFRKHGKEAFLKYYTPLYKEINESTASTTPDSPLNEHHTASDCTSASTEEQNKKLVYKCPSCPYVNARFHGVLTHCQMRHPDLVARADELQTDEILVANMVNWTMEQSSNARGYMCKKCQQIFVSMKKLKIHCEKDHNKAQATASEYSADVETEKRTERDSQDSVFKFVSVKNKLALVGTSGTGLNHQLGSAKTSSSNSWKMNVEKSVYKCSMCAYIGSCRKYLYCHYKNNHKLDALATYKMLEKYNKYKRSKPRHLLEAESAHVKCKMCPNLKFDSSQQLISHYSTFHRPNFILDFTVLTQATKKTTGLYRCSHCNKQMNGIRKLCYHLDHHREMDIKRAKRAPNKSIAENELPMLETVEELSQWNVKPVETFTVPLSPPSSPCNLTDVEQLELESNEDGLTCNQCGQMFMSRKGLHLHERSHAAMAAIKKQSSLSTSTLKHNINKYIIYKDGNLRPFQCSFCSYRTTVVGLWRRHFMKKHQDVLMDPDETDMPAEESAQKADKERRSSSEESNYLPELDEEPETTQESYSEPPDVQRQLNHYTLMAQAGDASKANAEGAGVAESSLFHCEVCNFNTGHLSSMRRHYLNRHGKKMLKCRDCNFFSGLRKTLEMHIEVGHSTCQSEPTHQKDLRCPFCLYQTKNKTNMIDHIVLHREERVVPIEVRRPKLSRYLQGIVFRCHKCTFTCGSPENLRLHMMKHDDIKPYKCRLCYFDCTRLSDLEAHLSDKHQIIRNHELVGQISLDQLEARAEKMSEEEPLSDLSVYAEDIKTEEIDIDCNEASYRTTAKNPGENNTTEDALRIKEAYQNKGQDGKNENEESLAKSSMLNLQHENENANTVQEKQDPCEQADNAFFSDTGSRPRIESTLRQRFANEGKNSNNQFEDWQNIQTNEGSSVTFTQQRENAAQGSAASSGKVTEKVQDHKLHIKALNRQTSHIQERIEEDTLRHVLLLDVDVSSCRIHRKSDLDLTVKTEQNSESAVPNNLSNENQPSDEQCGVSAGKNFTVDRHWSILGPNVRQAKPSHKGILGVSFTKCKENRMQGENNSKVVRDSCGETPALKRECMKEEMHLLSCYKEEDEDDRFEQTETQKHCRNLEHQEDEQMKEAENSHIPTGTHVLTDAETREDKLFICELCGRNLKNSSELERHIIRHGI